MDKIERTIKAIEKEKAMTPRAKLLNKLDSLHMEAMAVAGQVHSLCNDYREILYGYDKVETYRLQAFLDRLEKTEELANHLWGLASITYVRELTAD